MRHNQLHTMPSAQCDKAVGTDGARVRERVGAARKRAHDSPVDPPKPLATLQRHGAVQTLTLNSSPAEDGGWGHHQSL